MRVFLIVVWAIVAAAGAAVWFIVHGADNPDAAATAQILYLPVLALAAIAAFISLIVLFFRLARR